jgi:hypothetical protein
LQKKLEEDNKQQDFKTSLIQCVAPFFPDLMVDQFGNYLS